MSHRLEGKLVIATHNAGKLAEMRELIAPYAVLAIASSDLGLPEPEETGASFISNAVIKARAAADSAKIPALADDSGLCVAALDDTPGKCPPAVQGPFRERRRSRLPNRGNAKF
jgi:XTP/dITP diphosphohydrolase